MAPERDEGAVAIEQKGDLLRFSQLGQDSINVSKCVFWPAGGPVAPLFGSFVVDQILGSEYL
jgi:hypothetical protein